MMKIKFVFTTMALLNLAACAIGPTRHAIHAECRLELDAARTAVQLRDKGKDKLAMLQTLPPLHPDSTRLLRQMYQIVDEIYAYPDLNDIVYGIYRYEVCVHQLQHQHVPPTLAAVQKPLHDCQAHFSRQVSKAAVACVRAVFSPHTVTMPEAGNANLPSQPQ